MFDDSVTWPVFFEGETIYVVTNGAPGGDNIEIEWVCRNESRGNGMFLLYLILYLNYGKLLIAGSFILIKFVRKISQLYLSTRSVLI